MSSDICVCVCLYRLLQCGISVCVCVCVHSMLQLGISVCVCVCAYMACQSMAFQCVYTTCKEQGNGTYHLKQLSLLSSSPRPSHPHSLYKLEIELLGAGFSLTRHTHSRVCLRALLFCEQLFCSCFCVALPQTNRICSQHTDTRDPFTSKTFGYCGLNGGKMSLIVSGI